MNNLIELDAELKSNGIHLNKSGPFLRTYEILLSKYIDTDVSLVEIGVLCGGSLKLWKNYLGTKANIYGIDIHTPVLNESQIIEYSADQGSRDSIQQVISLIPKIDVLIDDGSHQCSHQINTFEEIYPKLSREGLYIVEDTHTSYIINYEGGYKKEGTFIEYCKNIIDTFYINEDNRIKTTAISGTIDSIIFYKDMVVFRKIR